MKKRVAWLAKIYALFLLIFIVQKLLFVALCHPADCPIGLGDVYDIVANGLLLDVPVVGYIMVLPLLLVLVTTWWPRELPIFMPAVIYFAAVTLVTLIMIGADIGIYPYWGFKLDATVFYYLDNMREGLSSAPFWVVFVGVMSIGFGSLGLTMFILRFTPDSFRPVPYLGRRIGNTVFYLIVAAMLFLSIRGGTGESTANVGKVYFSEEEFLNHAAINPVFSLLASVSKTADYASEFDYFDEPTRQKLFDGLYAPTPPGGERLLTTERPNVIVILMEGFGGQFVEAVSGRKDIAPNYNRLAREGVLFTNCYSNSFRTDRGVLSALSGYASFPTLSVMKLPAKSRTLPCLANTLNAQGYNSTFIYGGDINFTNMQSYLRTGGYGKIIRDMDFTFEERMANPWGAQDDVTFDRLKLMVYEPEPEPWHICFLTLSSHEPFDVPYERLDDKIANAFAFTDHCLGEFVSRIKRTPQWDNLLIVLLPDHGFSYPRGISHAQHHHNTMLWIGGAVARPRVITTLMNQSDMVATLLGQMNIDHSDYAYSRDVTSPAYTYPFAFYTFKEGIAFADSTGNTVYDYIADRAVEDYPAAGRPDTLLRARRVDRAKAIMQSFYDDIGAR